jgi:hypothetical protein
MLKFPAQFHSATAYEFMKWNRRRKNECKMYNNFYLLFMPRSVNLGGYLAVSFAGGMVALSLKGYIGKFAIVEAYK